MGIKSASLALPIVFLAYYYGSPPENFAGASAFKYPQILISNGFIRGSTGVSRDGREYFQFLGIPYAEPPVDSLRFESPRPAKNWDGVKIADKYKPHCLQLNFITGLISGSEDCLFLNVFVPAKIAEDVSDTDPYSANTIEPLGFKNRTSTTAPLYPVIVYLFGGYFMYGSSQLYGPQYFMDEDVLLVTLDYRVGALGFLSTGDGVIRGNMGLKDQNLALRWVQENIAAFGGDPNRVTIFGESAGASCVHFHMLSEQSRGLFSQAISNSGTALRTWQIVDHPAEQAVRLGHQLNCPTGNTKELAQCLKHVDGTKIVNLHHERMDILSNPLSQYSPSVESVIDGETFMYRHPIESVSKGLLNKVPWLLGVNSGEGLVYSSRIIRNKNVTALINYNWEHTAPILLNYDKHRIDVAERVRKFYLGENYFQAPNDFRKQFSDFTNMFTDRLYAVASRRSALEHSKYAPTYTYYMTYEGDFTFYNIFLTSGSFPRILELGYSVVSNWVKANVFRKQRPSRGVCHGDDISFLFHLGLLTNIKRTDRDYEISRAMVRSWSQFATDHTKLRFQNHIWPPIDANDLLFMNLNNFNGGLINDPFHARAKFWESIDLL